MWNVYLEWVSKSTDAVKLLPALLNVLGKNAYHVRYKKPLKPLLRSGQKMCGNEFPYWNSGPKHPEKGELWIPCYIDYSKETNFKECRSKNST